MDESEKKHCQEMFKQADSTATTYAEKAVLYAFYLNGGASTALLARAQESFYPAAASFAWGAFWAVVCMGASYIHQMLVAGTWKSDSVLGVVNIFSFTIQRDTVEKLRFIPIGMWICSISQFIRGVIQL